MRAERFASIFRLNDKKRINFQYFAALGIYISVRPILNILAVLFLSVSAVTQAVASTTKVELVLSAEAARPGDTVARPEDIQDALDRRRKRNAPLAGYHLPRGAAPSRAR